MPNKNSLGAEKRALSSKVGSSKVGSITSE